MKEVVDINRCKQCRRSFIQMEPKQKVCGTCLKKKQIAVTPPTPVLAEASL